MTFEENINGYLNCFEFSQLVGISRQKSADALKKCHNGKSWRSIKLKVYLDKGKGGKSGLQYFVQIDSIPQQFLKSVPEHLDERNINNPFPIAGSDSTTDNSAKTEQVQIKKAAIPQVKYKADELNFKLDVVKRINVTKPNTPERAALIKQLSVTVRFPYGKKRGQFVSQNTIREWVNKYEKFGMAELCRKSRNDHKNKRVMISREWDKVVKNLGINEENRLRIAVELKRHIKSLWRSGTPSAHTVQLNALPFAMNQIREIGGLMDDEKLRSICKLPENLIYSFAHYKRAAIYRQDAAKYAAKHNPRIRRGRANLAPAEWVAGDVHHIDIAFQREDSSFCTIKAVAWLDLATNRAFITPFLMPKGQMIRREHVLESFAAMCADPNWGIPTRLYLDRGGEYNWGELVEDLCRLKHKITMYDFNGFETAEAATGVHRSRAYNPQSKVIESLFGSLERSVFPQIKGHIGGDRMKKKTQNQGKAPIPYPGDFEAYKGSMKTALDYYHIKEQKGHLDGLSPNQCFQKFINEGWKSILLNPDEMAVAFCKKEFREVYAGGVVKWKGGEYRHDTLIPMSGMRKVQIGEPLYGDKSRLYLFDEEDQPIGIAEPVKMFDLGDVSGAGEQQRQSALYRQDIRILEAKTDKLDLEKVMRDAVESKGPAPQAEAKSVVSISLGHSQVAKESRNYPDRFKKEDNTDIQAQLLAKINAKRATG